MGIRDVFGEDVSIYSGTAFIGAAVKDIGTSPDQGAAYLYYDTNAPDLRLESDTGVSNADDITNSSNLAFELPNITIGAWVELLRNGVAVSSGIASGPTMTLADVNPPNGNSRYSIRQTLPDLTAIESSSTIVSVLTSLPTVSIDQSPNQSDSASSSPLNYRVRFSVPVSGFSTQSISYAGSTANTSGISAAITGSGSTYNVAVTPVFPNQGLLRVSVLTDSAQDEFGNLAQASTSIDNAILFDGVRDGSFELTNSGGGNPYWGSTSQLRGTALCGLVRCGISPTSAPRKGDAWVRFAGSTGGPAEQASISQSVALPAGGAAVLAYYLRMGYVNPPGATLLNVRLDGVLIQSISESSVADLEYVKRTVDLTPYADGGQHLLRFEFSQPGGATLDIFSIDDVSVSTPNVTVSGRVTNAEGRGVRNAVVRMTDSGGNLRTTITGPFGSYVFNNVQARDDFLLIPSSRRYNFASRLISSTSDLAGIDFVSTSQK
ncbi:MAG: carboxypeptidase regulatory-like domain-containing protein [Chloracidobacterium sp.]|nr:carboxypeptidase regulatory-like domain-containing protein [Chloracidobacterium sp.]